MSTRKVWVALLRAVNVGGTGKLAMADLTDLCRKLRYEGVRTYIASGNVVFRASGSESAIKKAMEGALERLMGRSPGVLVRTGAEMAAVAAANPFAGAPTNRVVAVFLDRRPAPDTLEAARNRVDEVLALGAREIYIHYPVGQGVSRLKIPAAERGTARNMNTVAKLAQLAAET